MLASDGNCRTNTDRAEELVTHSTGLTTVRLPNAEESFARRAFLFTLTAISLLFIPIVGQLYVAELVLVMVFVASIVDSGRPRVGAGIGAALLIWGLGTVLSDLAAGSEGINALRGILRLVFLAVDIFAIAYLVRNNIRLVYLLWTGVVCAAIIAFFFFPNPAASGEPWKFGVGIPITIAFTLILSRKARSSFVSASGFISIAALHFIMGSRSMSLICVVVALIFVFRTNGRDRRTSSANFKLVALSTAGIALAVTLTSAYDRLALDGVFGKIAASKAGFQSTGEFGSLFSGRSELWLSLQTIGDSPLLGGGSYSVASRDVTNSTAQLFDNWGYSDIAGRLSESAPAYHSEILGSWAENGILSVPFWVIVVTILIRAIVGVLDGRAKFPELIAILSVLSLWDVFFSPFGADRRFWLAATLVAILACVPFTSRENAPRSSALQSNSRPPAGSRG